MVFIFVLGPLKKLFESNTCADFFQLTHPPLLSYIYYFIYWYWLPQRISYFFLLFPQTHGYVIAGYIILFSPPITENGISKIGHVPFLGRFGLGDMSLKSRTAFEYKGKPSKKKINYEISFSRNNGWDKESSLEFLEGYQG